MNRTTFTRIVTNRQRRTHIKVIDGKRPRFCELNAENNKIVRYLKGITTPMKTQFYPNCKHIRRACSIGSKGAKEGTRVHLWVRHLVNCTGGSCTCASKLTGECPLYARRFVQDVERLGYEVLGSEVAAWIKSTGTMTLIDVMLKTPRGTLAVVELKTGYTGSIDAHPSRGVNQYMRAPFGATVPGSQNSALNHHNVQAVVGAYLFNNAYSGSGLPETDEAWVVYLNDIQRPDSYRASDTLTSWYPAHKMPWAQDPLLVKKIVHTI